MMSTFKFPKSTGSVLKMVGLGLVGLILQSSVSLAQTGSFQRVIDFNSTNENWIWQNRNIPTTRHQGPLIHSTSPSSNGKASTNKQCDAPSLTLPPSPTGSGFVMINDPWSNTTFFKNKDPLNLSVSPASGQITFDYLSGTYDGKGQLNSAKGQIVLTSSSLPGVQATGEFPAHSGNGQWSSATISLSVPANFIVSGSSDPSAFAKILADLDGISLAIEFINQADFGGTPGVDCTNVEFMGLDNIVISGLSTPIDAVDDGSTFVDGASGGATPTVLGNDTLNGAKVDLSKVTLGTTGAGLGLATAPNAGSIVMNPDGTIAIAAGTTAGTYEFNYEICEQLNPANCDTAKATIVVAQVGIDAVDDGSTSVDGTSGGATPTVLDNDTLNGAKVDLSKVTLGTTGAGLGLVTVPNAGSIVMNPDGTVAIAAGTTAGTYEFNYEICEQLNPANCDTAKATIVVVQISLIDEIKDDLKALLEDELATTLALQSNQMNTYSDGALERLRSRTAASCVATMNDLIRRTKIIFDTDKATIRHESSRTLDKLAEILEGCKGKRFEIAGHTDSDASTAYNMLLSQRRAQAVLVALAERGIDINTIIARGYGESRPIASNENENGKAKNRRVEFALIEEEIGNHPQNCFMEANTDRSMNISVQGAEVNLDGSMKRETYNCSNDSWVIFEGSLSHFETENALSQSMLNLSYRRERFVGKNIVRGYFLGIYGSQSDVTDLATGEVSGVGVNGGIYGAKKFNSGLYLDYYLGAAAGRHSFELDFSRSIGVVNAAGDYKYVAAMAGASISGVVQFPKHTVVPRVGIDYSYSPGGNVDVVSKLNSLQQSNFFKLDSLSGGRLFAEVRNERLIINDSVLFGFTPRVMCYQSVGNVHGACGVGGSIDFSSPELESGLTYSVEVEGERGKGFSNWSIRGDISKQLEAGSLRAQSGVNKEGSLSFGGSIVFDF